MVKYIYNISLCVSHMIYLESDLHDESATLSVLKMEVIKKRLG